MTLCPIRRAPWQWCWVAPPPAPLLPIRLRLQLQQQLLVLLAVVAMTAAASQSDIEVVFAVNCGGDGLIDSYGVQYNNDPLEDQVGVASDHGFTLSFEHLPAVDRPLFQTERYCDRNFGYTLPHLTDGTYTLVLKFSEVYFNRPNMKVFDVLLNGEHTIVSELDIFARVGLGVPHQEVVEFTVSSGQVVYGDEVSDIDSGGLRVDFIKGDRDNPKVNAILLIRGTAKDVPPLPSPPSLGDTVPPSAGASAKIKGPKKAKPSGPAASDPYDEQESSSMVPIVIGLAASVPLLFFVCRF